MRLDPSRALRAAALLTWAAFFWYLWLSDEWRSFVGPRTAWVVPFGTISLTLAAVAYATTVRASGPVRRPTPLELFGQAALLAPILALLAVPNPTLSTLAAERKRDVDISKLPAPDKDAVGGGEELSIVDVAIAAQNPDLVDEGHVKIGQKATIVGEMTGQSPGAKLFVLSRFRLFCCAADGVPYSVSIEPADGAPLSWKPGEWFEVDGVLARGPSNTIIVKAQRVEAIDEPAQPYF